MKRLLLLSMLFTGIGVFAQTYPKYKVQKKDTLVKKTEAAPAVSKQLPEPEQAPAKAKIKKRTGDFQALMEKGAIESKSEKYDKAADLYTQAFEVSTDETEWRALVSRATAYVMMQKWDKAIADYTTMIQNDNLPDQKKLAYTYFSRARAAQEMKNMELACNDVNKARELGLPEMFITGFDDCKRK